MKLLSSSFSSISSSSSSSTISTNTSSTFDSKSATASCLAGILRRILCSGTLPTYPSDHINAEEFANSSNKRFIDGSDVKAQAGPGLVAKLMGLDSMPETDFRASILRSRSMSSAETSRLVRAKSSASLREYPTFLELEDKEFFVLSFESVNDRGREFRDSKKRSSRRVRGKRRGNKGVKEDKDMEERRKVLRDLNGKEVIKRRNSIDHSGEVKDQTVSLASKKSLRHSESVEFEAWNPKGAKHGLRKKKKKENLNSNSKAVNFLQAEPESPVSVLDCGQFLVDPKVSISDGDSSSRRKLSLDTEGNLERPSSGPRPSLRRDDNLSGTQEWKYVGNRKKESEISQENLRVLDEIWRASEDELFGASWVRRWDFDHVDFRSVGEELEALILGHLVDELVDQFN